MQLVKIYEDSSFSNAAVPEGGLLIFLSRGADGNIRIRYKNHAGDFGDISGSGISDAPSDGKLYARKNGKWVEVTGGSPVEPDPEPDPEPEPDITPHLTELAEAAERDVAAMRNAKNSAMSISASLDDIIGE